MATDKIPEMVERIARILDFYAFENAPTVDDGGAYAWVEPKDENERQNRQWNARFKAANVIKAMREPTEAMWDAGKHRCHGVPLLDGSDRLTCGGFLGETPSEQWKRMIDAALGE